MCGYVHHGEMAWAAWVEDLAERAQHLLIFLKRVKIKWYIWHRVPPIILDSCTNLEELKYCYFCWRILMACTEKYIVYDSTVHTHTEYVVKQNLTSQTIGWGCTPSSHSPIPMYGSISKSMARTISPSVLPNASDIELYRALRWTSCISRGNLDKKSVFWCIGGVFWTIFLL